MASIGNAFKVGGAVSLAAAGTFNCPANSWAQVTLYRTGATPSWTVDGRSYSGIDGTPVVVIVGPSQALVTGTGTIATGVYFTNS